MRHIPLKATILLAVLGASAAAWWIGSADDRRVSECRARGVQDPPRLARCARGTEERDAVLGEIMEERDAAFRTRVRLRLRELRASKRSEVDEAQYERVLIEDLFDISGLDSRTLWYEPSEIPAGAAGRRFALEGAVLSGASLEMEDTMVYLSIGTAFGSGIDADIENLERAEREFIRKVCESLYIDHAYPEEGCPVVAYGQITFVSLLDGDWLDPDLGEQDLMAPIFRIEGLEFIEPVIP